MDRCPLAFNTLTCFRFSNGIVRLVDCTKSICKVGDRRAWMAAESIGHEGILSKCNYLTNTVSDWRQELVIVYQQVASAIRGT